MALGYTQEHLAYTTDLHPTAVSRLENGERNPHMDTILALAAALDTTASALLDGVVLDRREKT